jgi:hypothetical protein
MSSSERLSFDSAAECSWFPPDEEGSCTPRDPSLPPLPSDGQKGTARMRSSLRLNLCFKGRMFCLLGLDRLNLAVINSGHLALSWGFSFVSLHYFTFFLNEVCWEAELNPNFY